MPTAGAIAIAALSGLLLVGAKAIGAESGKGLLWAGKKTGCVLKHGIHHLSACRAKPKPTPTPEAP